MASQRTDSQRGEDRKVDQIVCELTKYDVTVGALQETEWFGDDVYQVNGSSVLTADRAAPTHGESVQRGESVALVIRSLAVDAWKRGGRHWKLCCNCLTITKTKTIFVIAKSLLLTITNYN